MAGERDEPDEDELDEEDDDDEDELDDELDEARRRRSRDRERGIFFYSLKVKKNSFFLKNNLYSEFTTDFSFYFNLFFPSLTKLEMTHYESSHLCNEEI